MIRNILFGVLVLIMTNSCERRNLEQCRAENTDAATEYHNSLFKILNNEDLTVEMLGKGVGAILDSFCQDNKCLEINLTLYSKDKETPYHYKKGNLNLEEFAYTNKERLEFNGFNLEIFHGVIYTTDEWLFKKGTQIRGTIDITDNELIEKVETLTFLEYPRN